MDAGHLPPLRLGSKALVQNQRTDKDVFVILLTLETAPAGERLFLPSLLDLVSTDNTPGAHESVRKSFFGDLTKSLVCDCEVGRR